MKNFVNQKYNAINMIEFDIDQEILKPLHKILSLPLSQDDFCSASPPDWNSDIRWISNNSTKSYNIFHNVFKSLLKTQGMQDLIKYIPHNNNIIMYSGFFVVRSKASASHFHVDWSNTTHNNGFTLITPLIQPNDGINLLFKDKFGSPKPYAYKSGKCIAFGSNFIHSTDIGTSSKPSILLSMNFGTDSMKHWDEMLKTISGQSLFYCLPNGTFSNSNLD